MEVLSIEWVSHATSRAQVHSWGDANGDAHFDQQDVLQVLRAGTYRTGQPASWRDGDGNGDGRFDELDIVGALSADTYLRGTCIGDPNPSDIAWRGKSCSWGMELPGDAAPIVLVPANQRPRALVAGRDRARRLPTQFGRALDPREIAARWGNASLHFVTQGRTVSTEASEVEGPYWSFSNNVSQPGRYLLVLECAGSLHPLWEIALVEEETDLTEPAACSSATPVAEIVERLQFPEFAAEDEIYVSDLAVDSKTGRVYLALRMVLETGSYSDRSRSYRMVILRRPPLPSDWERQDLVSPIRHVVPITIAPCELKIEQNSLSFGEVINGRRPWMT